MTSGGVSAAAWVETSLALALAVSASVVALILTIRNMMLHAAHYNFPRTQKYIFRILFVVPVYAICSVIAIVVPIGDVVVVALTVRDCYEAFVVYSFLTLILEHAGGDYNCIEQIKHLPPVPHPWPLCCLAHVRRDGNLLRLSKQATLQFVVVKPLMAILSLIALAAGRYFSSPFQVTLLVVYNTSYSVALYGLLMFYKATRPLLTPFKPVQKFVAVKSVIFATYWQSVVVHFIPGVPFALLLNSAFPWHDFITEQRDKPVLENVREMLSVRDVFQDAYHSFMPSYQDYVVARDDHDSNSSTGGVASGGAGTGTGTPSNGSRVFRMRTFLIGNLDRGQMGKTDPSSRLEGNGDAKAGNGRLSGMSAAVESRRVHQEDLDGGLDEDWGQDVDVIELQNSLPDSRSSGRKGRRRRRAEVEIDSNENDKNDGSKSAPGDTPTTATAGSPV